MSEITSFNIALLDKCISQYPEYPVFTLGSILSNIATKECIMKYCHTGEGNGEKYLFQYHPTLEDMTEINNTPASPPHPPRHP